MNRRLVLTAAGIFLAATSVAFAGSGSSARSTWSADPASPSLDTGSAVVPRIHESAPDAAWTNVAPLPLDVFGPQATAANGLLYVGGGYSFTTGANTQNFGVWDPDANTYTALAPIPDTSAALGAMVYGHNGKIYLIGGEDITAGTVATTTRIYDIATNTWSAGAPMPGPRAFAGYGYYNGSVYIAGGYTTSTVDSGQVTLWRYDIAADGWDTSLASLPVALGGYGSAVIDNVLYVAGGRDTGGQYAATYGYDFDTDSWATVASMPATNNVPGSAVFSGQMWIFGGGNPFASPEAAPLLESPETTNACVAYDPSANAWSACPSLLTGRSFPGGTAVRNVPVALGGYSGTTLASVEANFTTPGPLPDGNGHRIIVNGDTAGYLPNGFARGESLNIAEYAYGSSLPAPNEFALFDTHDPWGYTLVKDAITQTGHFYDEFTPANLAGFTFSDYRVVVLNFDDTFPVDFDSDYEAAIPALEDYVRGGGVVWLQGALQGNGGEMISLPFGGTLTVEFHSQDFVVDPANPMVTAMANPVFGGFASHSAMSGNPAASNVVKRTEDANGAPTLYELSSIIFDDDFESGDTSNWSQVQP
jgi:N-acetylneuraminic acid mutarotase